MEYDLEIKRNQFAMESLKAFRQPLFMIIRNTE